MQKLSCLIVDDEPIAREIIKTYCGHLDHLEVAGMCGSALEAKSFLQQRKVDILFLDINMPLMDGISFVKTLRKQPEVIFTTAYREYAVDAFELSRCRLSAQTFLPGAIHYCCGQGCEKLRPTPNAVLSQLKKEKTTPF